MRACIAEADDPMAVALYQAHLYYDHHVPKWSAIPA
jgi:hypothetical protein